MTTSARVMTDHEALEVEHAWNMSDEKRALDDRQKRLKEAIELKPAGYTPDRIVAVRSAQATLAALPPSRKFDEPEVQVRRPGRGRRE